jgi:glycosyltransferase involved in cell wall biosynthesis
MHILFLTQIIPYPPDAGPKVKTWHVLRYLANKGHHVTLVSFIRPKDEEYISVIKEICQEVYTVPIHRSSIRDAGYWIRSQLNGRPFLIERDDRQEMREVVENLINTNRFDVIHADQLTMTQFCRQIYRPKLVDGEKNNRNSDSNGGDEKPFLIFDAHNATWTVLERMTGIVPWYVRPFTKNEAKKVKKYEGEIVTEVNHTFTVTEIDRASLLSAANSVSRNEYSREVNISVVPIAIDTNKIAPVQLLDSSCSILTLGSLHYPPNAEGIRWFFQEVFPIIQQNVPKVKLTIIGKNPPSDFENYANKNSEFVDVTGYVPDIEPYLKDAAVAVVPVRAGGGMRVRIIELLAYGQAVVTTTIGLEGIDAIPGKEVFVADSPQDFARAVIKLLTDIELRKALAQNGRRLVERKYDWRVVYQDFENFYREIELG